MENGPFIDDLPINSMVISHGYVSHNQMVCIYIYSIPSGYLVRSYGIDGP